MPIRPENKDRYPTNWHEIRTQILRRAGNCCEFCKVQNHALGGRDGNGKWHDAVPLGNGGRGPSGLEWPRPGDTSWCCRGAGRRNMKQLRIVRIVLTIAHLDHTPENCAPENLKALCQRCHLNYDKQHHRETRRATMRRRQAVGDLFGVPA